MHCTLKSSLILVAFLALLLAPRSRTLAAPASMQLGSLTTSWSAPNLVISPVTGPNELDKSQTALYLVSIRNAGDPAGAIWLQIDLDAPMTAGGTILAGNGFFCLVESHQYLCDGGALASGETATLSFDVRGGDAGSGMIRVSASADGTPDEAAGTPYRVTVVAPVAD